jgi:hypothetical protein
MSPCDPPSLFQIQACITRPLGSASERDHTPVVTCRASPPPLLPVDQRISNISDCIRADPRCDGIQRQHRRPVDSSLGTYHCEIAAMLQAGYIAIRGSWLRVAVVRALAFSDSALTARCFARTSRGRLGSSHCLAIVAAYQRRHHTEPRQHRAHDKGGMQACDKRMLQRSRLHGA